MRGAGGTSGGVGVFFAGLAMIVVGGYLLLTRRNGWKRGLGSLGLQRLWPIVAAAAGRNRLALLRRQEYRRLAAHGVRCAHHSGRNHRESSHLFRSDIAVRHPGDSGTRGGRHRCCRAVVARPAVAGSVCGSGTIKPSGADWRRSYHLFSLVGPCRTLRLLAQSDWPLWGHSSAGGQSRDQGAEEQNHEDIEQDLGETCGRRGNPAEAEHGSDQRDDGEDHCPAQHTFLHG